MGTPQGHSSGEGRPGGGSSGHAPTERIGLLRPQRPPQRRQTGTISPSPRDGCTATCRSPSEKRRLATAKHVLRGATDRKGRIVAASTGPRAERYLAKGRTLRRAGVAVVASAILVGSVTVVASAGAVRLAHATAYWKQCPPRLWNAGSNPANFNVGPRNDKGLPMSSVRAHLMSCAAVRKAIAHGTITIHCCGEPPPGSFWAHFRTRGFSCRGPDPIRCTSGRRRFEFNWAE